MPSAIDLAEMTICVRSPSSASSRLMLSETESGPLKLTEPLPLSAPVMLRLDEFAPPRTTSSKTSVLPFIDNDASVSWAESIVICVPALAATCTASSAVAVAPDSIRSVFESESLPLQESEALFANESSPPDRSTANVPDGAPVMALPMVWFVLVSVVRFSVPVPRSIVPVPESP